MEFIYPRIYPLKAEGGDAELTQLVLNKIITECREILGYSELEDCVLIISLVGQRLDEKRPHYKTHFAFASSPEAEQFYSLNPGEDSELGPAEPTINFKNELLKSDLEDCSGQFCKYVVLPDRLEAERVFVRFLVQGCFICRQNENPNEGWKPKTIRLLDDVFELYHNWLIKPGRNDNQYVIGFDI
ncbi:MAG: hypothetical protein ACK5MU_03850 [Candidatus Saccharimonadales bacterium]